MINFYNQVPSVYTSASRDFQYLSWLINIVLNSVKHNVDDLYDLPNTKADPRITELLAMTLGFKIKRKYDQNQLAMLVGVLPSVLKYKGTLKAVELAGKALIIASGSLGIFNCELVDNCLQIQLPEDLVDTTLFTDLLPYILPAGITSRVVTKTDIKADGIDSIELAYDDTLYANFHEILGWDDESQTATGLAGLYNIDAAQNVPEFNNYKRPVQFDENNNPVNINAGLLDNSLIPALDIPLGDAKSAKSGQKEEED